VIDWENSKISHDPEDVEAEELAPVDYLPPSASRMYWAGRLISPDKDKLVKYCIAASIVLHVLAFAAVPHWLQVQPTKSQLRPGEKVTPIRLVESPKIPQKPEPPPEKASAISDRDHTAKVERIPKVPPVPKPPMGQVAPIEKRMASLTPPVAPEDLAGAKEERSKALEPPKPSPNEDKAVRRNNQKAPDQDRPKQKKDQQRDREPDLRVTSKEMKTAFAPPSGGGADFHPDGDLDEAVVDINTREDRFFSYLLHLKRKIEQVWVYPSAAAHSGIGGSLTVEFSIAKGGDLLGVTLLDSSGHQILDESAMKAIRSAAPYYPFPPSVRAKRLRIRANFIYVTSDFFRRIM